MRVWLSSFQTLLASTAILMAGSAAAQVPTSPFPQAQPAPPTAEDASRIAAALQQHFVDPDSLQFADLRFTRLGRAPVLCGQVNARNRAGGYNGYRQFIVFAGDVIVDEGRPGTRQAFERMQQMTCNAAPSIALPISR